MSDSTQNVDPRDAHLLSIKQEIVKAYPSFQERATKAWGEIITELGTVVQKVKAAGPNYIPQVKFEDLDTLAPDVLSEIRRKGSVVIRDVIPDEDAKQWKKMLAEFVAENPDVEGMPAENKQFFQLYWTKPQVQARSHPNMLKAITWLNKLYHTTSGEKIEGVDLETPLSYADRFRIRHPGFAWGHHPPHVDGGAIERWEDPSFRTCFEAILSGNWQNHDPYELGGRVNARSSLYKRPNQASIFRTFQGWLAVSETAPTEGTLKVFPDVLLSNAYTILRPFFKPTVPVDSADILKAENWVFDISAPEFPGIVPIDGGYMGPRPTNELHPHLKLDESMTSVPKVYPGDTVFWHCDVVHSVEQEHTGKESSAVMYIPAVPLTPLNQAYIENQSERFLKGIRPSDFPQGVNESNWKGIGTEADITNSIGRRAMGLPISVN